MRVIPAVAAVSLTILMVLTIAKPMDWWNRVMDHPVWDWLVQITLALAGLFCLGTLWWMAFS